MAIVGLILVALLLAVLLRRLDAAGERALIARIATQDEQAFATLYDHYAKTLYSVVVAVVKRQEEAEEVLQEVFLLIWRKAGAFDTTRENVYAWLTTLARHRAVDRIRSRAYRDTQMEVTELVPDLSPPDQAATPLDALIMEERAKQMRGALGEIPAEQREVIEQAYFFGYSQSELAERLNVPLGTVKTRMRQGMIKLRVLLEGQL